jgi:hypothetical protein
MSDTRTTADPEVIEQDIRRTQDEMSRTVDKIGDQLSVKNLFNALLDKADENNVDARYLLDGARRNPIALGLIAAGAIWLVSDKDSKFPSKTHFKSDSGNDTDFDYSDIDHRDYVSHMSSFEMRDDEDPLAYQRRRDLHRANFMMVERNHDEDDHSFRERLDGMTEKFREKRRAWSDSTSQAGSATKAKGQQALAATKQTGQQAVSKAQDVYGSNPLVGGILAAAIGAALGSTIPVTRQEQEKLGGIGEKARDMAGEQKDKLTEQVIEKKDQLLEKADQKLSGGTQQSGSQQQTAQTGASPPEFSGVGAETNPPFIIRDRTE